MVDEYPELDDAMMNALVSDYEAKQSLPSLDDDPDLPPVPIPPEANHSLELPVFDETPPFEDGFIQEKPIEKKKETKALLPVENVPIIKSEDVNDLELLENVFDKRITDKQVNQEIEKEQNKNDSGRLLDKKDVEVKTELNDAEILTITKLRFMAERYNIPVLNDFTDNLMTLKISRMRKGRREFIEGLHADEKRDRPDEGFFSRVFGGMRGGQ